VADCYEAHNQGQAHPTVVPQSRHALVVGPNLPPPVEDFVGRKVLLAELAVTFFNGRRAVWLHGCEGIGKSALATEFCRFYALPGDRLFAPLLGKGGGANVVSFCGLCPVSALACLKEALRVVFGCL